VEIGDDLAEVVEGQPQVFAWGDLSQDRDGMLGGTAALPLLGDGGGPVPGGGHVVVDHLEGGAGDGGQGVGAGAEAGVFA
jgi:hypothetical protein